MKWDLRFASEECWDGPAVDYRRWVPSLPMCVLEISQKEKIFFFNIRASGRSGSGICSEYDVNTVCYRVILSIHFLH